MLLLEKKTLSVLFVLFYCNTALSWARPDGDEEEAVDLLPVLPLLDEEAADQPRARGAEARFHLAE